MLKKVLLGLVAILVIIQFIRPDKNDSGENANDITTAFEVPQNVADIMVVACNDCHTNQTNYPWYANVQPVAWWLDHHVTDGKRHLNFSEFTRLPLAIQYHKLEEVEETVEEGEMPLPSYTYLGLHAEADLSDAQRKTLIDWAKSQMAMMKAKYPADSLVMKRRRPPSE